MQDSSQPYFKESWKISRDTAKLADLREKMEGFMKQVKIDDLKKSRMILCADEAAANIVEHMATSHEGKDLMDFEVEANLDSGMLMVIIRDEGQKYDPTQQKDVNLAEHIRSGKKGGLGVHIMRTQLDVFRYEYVDSQNVLYLGMKIK